MFLIGETDDPIQEGMIGLFKAIFRIIRQIKKLFRTFAEPVY